MDAFALAISYGIKKLSKKQIIFTAISVGIFHFFMPLLGSFVGISLFEHTLFKPRYVVFFIFLLISISMFFDFFEDSKELKTLNLLGIIIFSFSVSLDSFSVGLGLKYIYDSIILSVSLFSIISFMFTLTGFVLGKALNKKIGRYSFLFGSVSLFLYSMWVLTK